MHFIGALNEESDEPLPHHFPVEARQEEQESDALELHNEALAAHEAKDYAAAERLFKDVLSLKLVLEAPAPTEDAASCPGFLLKYSSHKNLGKLSSAQHDMEKALDHYFEAALIDQTDVSLWVEIGCLALEMTNIALARHSFEQGLKHSENHWFSLDNLITVLYVIGDYAGCLSRIAQALEIDKLFIKGLAIRDKIFREEPYFMNECRHMRVLFDAASQEEECKSEYQQYVEEALIIREKRRMLSKHEELHHVKLGRHMAYFTWACLGECLFHLYEETMESIATKSLCWPVDLERYAKTQAQQESLPCQPQESTARKAKSANKDVDDKKLKRKKTSTKSTDSSLEPIPKRRSARQTKGSKAREEEVNWMAYFQSYLPDLSSWTVPEQEDDESQLNATCDDTSQANSQTPAVVSQGMKQQEARSVSEFINSNMQNGGCIDLLVKWLLAVANHKLLTWENSLQVIYLKIYNATRKSFVLPPLSSCSDEAEELTRFAKMCVFAIELQLAAWLKLSENSSTNQSPLKAKQASDDSSAIQIDGKLVFIADMQYLGLLVSQRRALGAYWQEFAIRVSWLQARVFMLQGHMELSLNTLNRCIVLIGDMGKGATVELCNLETENIISIDAVEKRLETLYRCQSLEEIQQLYDEEQYDRVIQLLAPLIDAKNAEAKGAGVLMTAPEKMTQLMLLQQSMLKTEDYLGCFHASSVILAASVVTAASQSWKETFQKALACLESCFLGCSDILGRMPKEDVINLAISLVKLIELSVDLADNGDQPYATVLPWLHLYRIIKFCYLGDGMTAPTHDVDQSCISDVVQTKDCSLTDFIHTAHGHLGRRLWCCHGDGIALLQFFKDLHSELINGDSKANKKGVTIGLEQCILCLYGHPAKKPKSRGLQDHAATQVSLTWEYAKMVFDVFKPLALPSLDSKLYTISLEVQNIMRRIVNVVPQKEVEVITFEQLQSFVDGVADFPVASWEEQPRDRTKPSVQDIFYCLGDFYFKNKEFNKAIKYYTHDVCLNPKRFESWAAMALARGSRLEEKINACEPKSDGPIKKHITCSMRCFEMASKINGQNCMILEEYGSTAYMLTSHASRIQRELIQDGEFTKESEEALCQRRDRMLMLAEKCFRQARQCVKSDSGEPWLHSYILGKTAEKMKESPSIYLEFYEKAAHDLEEADASYPKRIPYHGPPDFSIEALEIYYRLHASILRIVTTSPVVDYGVVERYLDYADAWPFLLKSTSSSAGAASDAPRLKLSSTSVADRSPEQAPSRAVDEPPATLVEDATKHDSMKLLPAQKGDDYTEETRTGVAVTSMAESSPIDVVGAMAARHDGEADMLMDDILPSEELDAMGNGNKSVEKGCVEDSGVQGKERLQPQQQEEMASQGQETHSSSDMRLDTSHSVEAGTLETANPQQQEDISPSLQADLQATDRHTGGLHDGTLLQQMGTQACKSPQSEDGVMSASPYELKLPNESKMSVEIPRDDDRGLEISSTDERDLQRKDNMERKCPMLPHSVDVTITLTTVDDDVRPDIASTPCDANPAMAYVAPAAGVACGIAQAGAVSSGESGMEHVITVARDDCLKTDAIDKSDPLVGQNDTRARSVTTATVKNAPVRIHARTFGSSKEEERYKAVVDRCINAFSCCLKRFPEHYKSQYRMTYCFTYLSTHKDLHLARRLLLGLPTGKEADNAAKDRFVLPLHGMFTDRSKTNLFQYLWRIPIDEIDRAGSFCSHTCRGVELLLHVLYQLEDWETLINVSSLLHRTPEKDRKYLRDNDRAFLAIKALDLVHEVLKTRLLALSEDPALNARSVLLDCYDVWRHAQKMQTSTQTTDHLLVKGYKLMQVSQQQDVHSIKKSILLEMAIKYCQSAAADTSKRATSVSHHGPADATEKPSQVPDGLLDVSAASDAVP